jgi:hypothetical protein
MSIVWILFSMMAFGGLHSALASLTAKALAHRWLGPRTADGAYRLFFNFIATLTALPPFALALLLPGGPPLWRIPGPLLFVTFPLQLGARAGMAASLWRVGLQRFLGIRQLLCLLAGQPDPRDPPVLRTDGVHGWVRHPL